MLLNLSLSVNAQEHNIETQKTEIKDSLEDSKQRYISYSIGYHNPIATGDNFIGNGLEGNGGMNFKLQIYIYKQFFIGGFLGASYFKVKDTKTIGNYERSRIAEQYAFIGYEFVPTKDFRIGVTASVVGNSRYKNKYNSEVHQNDSANLQSYGVYLTYEISREFMLYIDYAYRIDKTKIDVPVALEDTFKKGTFNQIGIGVKFSFIGKELISSFK